MGNTLRDALIQANLVTLEHAQKMHDQDLKLRSHIQRQVELRKNVQLLESVLQKTNSHKNHREQRLAYVRWYIAQHLPRNYSQLCFFCGEEGMHPSEVEQEASTLQVSCALAGVSTYQTQLEVANIRRRTLTSVEKYLQLVDMPEDIRDFCYGLSIQACGTCYAYSAFLQTIV